MNRNLEKIICILIIIIFLCPLLIENNYSLNTSDIEIKKLDLRDQAIQNITEAQNEIYNATEKLIYLETLNGEISDLVEVLDISVNLLNNATQMFNQTNYNESIYFAEMSKGNASQVILDANSRITETIQKNQQIMIISIIIIVVVIIIVIAGGFLIYKLVKKYQEKKLMKMKISLVDEGEE
ncbi:MAG: hypothetical protein GF329_20025 [Candidatus Lokiarchaeota archaeon]|nr:hypothetical protein [Candidatus Lokiarchaeota archaeon]